MKYIKLTKNQRAMVDDEDFDVLSKLRWYANWYPNIKGYYARRQTKLMHRFIMNAPNGKQVDHINGDTLDNRKSNLKVCTARENTSNNYRHRNGKLVGVTSDRRKNKVYYKSRININNKTVHLGYFSTSELAHKAYINCLNSIV